MIHFRTTAQIDIEADNEDDALECAGHRASCGLIPDDDLIVDHVEVLGTTEEILRMDRQARILREQRAAKGKQDGSG